MSMLVKLLGTFAPGHVLEHGGREFVFKAIDQKGKAALTVAYFKRAREAVYAIKDEVEEEEYDRQLGRVMEAYRRGQLDFPGMEAFAYYMGAGLPEMVAFLTGCTPDEAVTLLKARSAETLHVVLCVMASSMGEVDKKKLASLEGTKGGRQLVELLLSSRTPSTNGSPCSKPTGQPASPEPASASATSPS